MGKILLMISARQLGGEHEGSGLFAGGKAGREATVGYLDELMMIPNPLAFLLVLFAAEYVHVHMVDEASLERKTISNPFLSFPFSFLFFWRT